MAGQLHTWLCRSGEIGIRTRLKIWRGSLLMSVRVRPPAPILTFLLEHYFDASTASVIVRNVATRATMRAIKDRHPSDDSTPRRADPPLKWAGGKRWLVPHIEPLWRPHRQRRYLELFCGGL